MYFNILHYVAIKKEHVCNGTKLRYIFMAQYFIYSYFPQLLIKKTYNGSCDLVNPEDENVSMYLHRYSEG